MGITKVKTKNGETKWEVRVYQDGRDSARIRRRFDRRTDAEEFLIDYENDQREKKKNPFKTMSFEDRTFAEEAEYWFNDGKNRFSAGHIVRIEGVFREIMPRFGKLTINRFTPEFLTRYQQEEKAKGLECKKAKIASICNNTRILIITKT